MDYLEVVNRGYVRVYFKADRGGAVSQNWVEVTACRGLLVCFSLLMVEDVNFEVQHWQCGQL